MVGLTHMTMMTSSLYNTIQVCVLARVKGVPKYQSNMHCTLKVHGDLLYHNVYIEIVYSNHPSTPTPSLHAWGNIQSTLHIMIIINYWHHRFVYIVCFSIV